MMMSTASRQGQGIFGTHYGLPLTGSHLVVTKSHKEEAALQIIFILNFDTINDGEDGGGVGDGSGERHHPVALNCLQNFLVLLWIMVKLTAVRMIAKKCAITLLREATRKPGRNTASCLLLFH